jgi:hypothetical protein
MPRCDHVIAGPKDELRPEHDAEGITSKCDTAGGYFYPLHMFEQLSAEIGVLTRSGSEVQQ